MHAYLGIEELYICRVGIGSSSSIGKGKVHTQRCDSIIKIRSVVNAIKHDGGLRRVLDNCDDDDVYISTGLSLYDLSHGTYRWPSRQSHPY